MVLAGGDAQVFRLRAQILGLRVIICHICNTARKPTVNENANKTTNEYHGADTKRIPQSLS
jgi:hypothetical protein